MLARLTDFLEVLIKLGQGCESVNNIDCYIDFLYSQRSKEIFAEARLSKTQAEYDEKLDRPFQTIAGRVVIGRSSLPPLCGFCNIMLDNREAYARANTPKSTGQALKEEMV